MTKLTLNDIRACLVFLLRTRRPELDAITDAAGYARVLERVLAQIEVLGPEALGRAVNADDLATADALHDALGNAIADVAQAHANHPTLSREVQDAARFALELLVPSRRQLQASYGSEASRAAERRPRVEAGRARLELLKTADGSLYGWAVAFLDAGDHIGSLLSGRADTKGDRTLAPGLRTTALGKLGRLRAAVADALDQDPDNARRVDNRLFGYLDLLSSMRDRGSSEATPPPPADPAPAT